MNLDRFKLGDVLHLDDGSRAEVLAPSEDGQWIRARYIEAAEDPLLSGTEDLIADHEVRGFSPAPPGPEWGERVSVVLHHISESEEGAEGYEAVAMSGLPLGVSVEASDADTAQEALERLLGALAAFGYSGTIVVQDLTQSGRSESYEVEIGGNGPSQPNL